MKKKKKKKKTIVPSQQSTPLRFSVEFGLRRLAETNESDLIGFWSA